jgi:polar amino acid transport system ATP-binding protein
LKLEIDDVSKSFGKQKALSQINLSLENLQTLAIIGPSGSGKSTLLRLIAGLEKVDRGSIKIDDKPIPDDENGLRKHRQSIGTVFQSWNLFPHLTALENIAMPLYRVHGYSRKDAEESSLALLERFSLQNHALKRPAELSGGQCQRVAIVRAIAIKPKILLFDEPTSALDPLMTSEVLDLINELKEEGSHLILSSHHLGFVKRIADYVAFIAEGKLIECGTASEIFLHPRSENVKKFLNQAMKY